MSTAWSGAREGAEEPPPVNVEVEPRAGDVGEAALRAAHATIARERSDGEAFLSGGQFADACAAFERMRDAARGAGLGRDEGHAHRLLAEALIKADAPEPEIEDTFKQALTIAHKQDDMELSFNTLTGMGAHAEKTDDLELAEHFYLQALALARRVLTEREEATAECKLGLCLAQHEDRRTECVSHFQKAIALHSTNGADDQLLASLRWSLASALSAQGRVREAEGEYDKALSLARKASDLQLQETVLKSLVADFESRSVSSKKARNYQKQLAELQEQLRRGGEALAPPSPSNHGAQAATAAESGVTAP